jgi:hypothetical protein
MVTAPVVWLFTNNIPDAFEKFTVPPLAIDAAPFVVSIVYCPGACVMETLPEELIRIRSVGVTPV